MQRASSTPIRGPLAVAAALTGAVAFAVFAGCSSGGAASKPPATAPGTGTATPTPGPATGTPTAAESETPAPSSTGTRPATGTATAKPTTTGKPATSAKPRSSTQVPTAPKDRPTPTAAPVVDSAAQVIEDIRNGKRTGDVLIGPDDYPTPTPYTPPQVTPAP
ncbi:hypothetical protein [Yinghuangia soli]|uniref:Uncharacterized protein n=1 Tax=Yinghuangia soli TaxID=2908204 RepID=A0AA41Q1J4_9ACTN|nr:hypothetical protein [Yinghuangia soli]MCF2529855.1 hypothetical protein [Yinghuangia soli]